MLSVVLRAIDALERQHVFPEPALQGEDVIAQDDPERSLEHRLDAVEANLGDVLSRLGRLEAERPAEHAKTDEPAPEVVDRQPDTQRCECGTASGGRCRNKTTSLTKAVVEGRIGEYGSCKRHVRDFKPYSKA